MKHMIKITKVTRSILEDVISKFKMLDSYNYTSASDLLKQMVTTHDNSKTFLTIDVSTSDAYFFVGVPKLDDKVYHNVHEFRDFVKSYNRLTNIANPLVGGAPPMCTMPPCEPAPAPLTPIANVAALRPEAIGTTHRYENETYGEIFDFSIGKDGNYVFLAGQWIELKGVLPFDLTPIETDEEKEARLRKEELFERVEKAFFNIHGNAKTADEYIAKRKVIRDVFDIIQEQNDE